MVPRDALSRERIVDAARDVIATGGLDALSLRRVASRLGVTAPALYAHVDDKDDLLRAVAEREFTALLTRLEEIASQAEDPLEAVRAQCHAYVDHAVASPALYHVMFAFRPAWGDGVPEELPLATKAFTSGADTVAAAIAAGRLGGDPLLTSLAVWSAVHGVVTLVLARDGFAPEYLSMLVDTVVDAVLRGLAR